jgi:hypothetical protein
LHDVVEAFAHERPYDWDNRHPAAYFGDSTKDPDMWVDGVYRKPNLFYYMVIKDAVFEMQDLGSNPKIRAVSDGVINRVLWEVFLREPWRFVSMAIRYATALPGGGAETLVFGRIFAELRLSTLSPDNGPASREFIDAARIYLNDSPTEMRRIVPPSVFGKDYSGNVDGFINEQLLPGRYLGDLFWGLWLAMDYMKDPMRALKLYGAVNREAMARAPDGPWGVYRARANQVASQLATFFTGPYGDQPSLYFYNYAQCTKGDPGIERELLSGMRLFSWIDIEPEQVKTDLSWIEEAIQGIWFFVRYACTIIIAPGAVFCLRSRYRWPILVMVAFIGYHALVNCIYGDPQPRYIDQILPVALLVVGFMATSLYERINQNGRARIAQANLTTRPED